MNSIRETEMKPAKNTVNSGNIIAFIQAKHTTVYAKNTVSPRTFCGSLLCKCFRSMGVFFVGFDDSKIYNQADGVSVVFPKTSGSNSALAPSFTDPILISAVGIFWCFGHRSSVRFFFGEEDCESTSFEELDDFFSRLPFSELPSLFSSSETTTATNSERDPADEVREPIVCGVEVCCGVPYALFPYALLVSGE